MGSNSKTTLLYILEDLLEEEFTTFKFQLANIAISEEYRRIPRSTLHQASRVKLADLLIQFYGDGYSRIVTKEVLITIGQRNLAEKLSQGIENPGSSIDNKAPKKRKQDKETGPDGLQKKIRNIFNKKKTSNESASSSRELQSSNDKKETAPNQHFLHLLRQLNLASYYPKKMTKVNTLLINKTSLCDTQPKAEGELPVCFLEKLLVLDYHLRYLVYRGNLDTVSTGPQTLKPTELGRTFEDFFIIKKTKSASTQTYIHPMDIQMAIFHCADDFTRQYVLTKLSICQFALPLLVPSPCSPQIEFPLWSLRQIRRSWKEVEQMGWEKKIKNYNNQLISWQPIHTVSFISFGNCVSTSKSQILNSLLSKGKHDHFSYHHPREGNNRCLLIEGMVEICWFFPGGRAEDRFENCIAFTNLHGNAETHESQVRFLQEVSSVTVILLSTSAFDKVNSSLLHEIWNSSKPLICLFEDVENIMDGNSVHKVRIGIKDLNKVELAGKITATLSQLLKKSGSPHSLSDWANVARKYKFIIDENQEACQEAEKRTKILMDILRKVKLSEIKEKLLPLQGSLWHDWCKKDKELHQLREKGNRSIEKYTQEIEKEKQKIRCEQYHKVINLSDLINYFLESLQSHPETHIELYFLEGLSMLIDQLTTRELDNLHQKHSFLLAQVRTEKEKHSKRESLRDWEAELDALTKEIRDSTLGIEHLMREVGQIYEALEEASSQTHTLFVSLPQMAADLMISGIPIELMDGDASYVPLKWVAAVFDKVSEKLGDKRVFVLSVLGLQSSGKSTLLNAMFGLQFSLSAGRCTRGAYMQLLKVEEMLREELGYDFVLVVDTEGLRASALINKAQNEENELATFVIGLGDLTLINIFGKDLSEIQDILQIAIHAFLRMKQLNISPRCLFVHQNIEEIIDTNQSMERRRWLGERLDEMTLAAAKYEQCSDVATFNDVIQFDPKTHIHYFAHLWEGSPPMAPPNPCYSHNVQKLKSRILKNAKEESRGNILKISELKIRIRDLWRALVNENFIFRFKNTREVLAMSKLETMYNRWTWELRSHVLDLNNQLSSQIRNGEAEEIKRSLIDNKIVDKHEAIKQELQRYFREDRDRNILAQWKVKFEDDLKNLKEELTVETMRKCEDLISGKKVQDLWEEHQLNFEHMLLEKIEGMAVPTIGKELHDKKLRDLFNKIWSENISILLPATLPPAEDPDIDIELENILLEHFKQLPNIVNKIRYRDTKKTFCINYSKHVITFQKLQVYGPSLEEFEKDIINKTTAQIVKLVKEMMHKREQLNEGYSSSYFHEILQVINQEAEDASQGARFMLTNRYKLELALELCQEAANSFKKMRITFKKTNNPVLYLESKREEFFTKLKLS
ncbi:interferon-induced very large GTPase 1-like [Pipistrellus kuhlii]|uniref:interferon-induced very large GTPase 1-like n=1 Tax=Pipistrellus kuhlii TaxID=59472 RepID=UPI00174EFB26|nr:interferon-induced very large GTPase 1-like [Pipistrellus kuhlii]XP_036283684.1 interferon-induced very large GTPase 1-like [Pipistrellus kuhlii]